MFKSNLLVINDLLNMSFHLSFHHDNNRHTRSLFLDVQKQNLIIRRKNQEIRRINK